MSLWAEYKLEREGKYTIESDDALCVYSINEKAGYCYLEDLYVKPERRHQGKAMEITNFIFQVAKSKNIKRVITSVVPTAYGSNYSLKCIMNYGFKLQSCSENIIFFEKEVE